MSYLRHRTVHEDDIRLALLGLARESTCLVDVVAHRLSLHVTDGVRIEHLTVDLHRSFILRYVDAVTLAQHDVLCATGIGQRLVELDTHRVGLAHLVFLQLFGIAQVCQAGITRTGSLFLHARLQVLTRLLQHSLGALALLLRVSAFQTGTLCKRAVVHTAGHLDEVAQSLVLP